MSQHVNLDEALTLNSLQLKRGLFRLRHSKKWSQNQVELSRTINLNQILGTQTFILAFI